MSTRKAPAWAKEAERLERIARHGDVDAVIEEAARLPATPKVEA